MIEAKQAPVRPRVFSLPSTTSLLLDEEIRSFLKAKARGQIAIVGPPGSGKTTALEHLAAKLLQTYQYQVNLLAEPQVSQLADAPYSLVIYTVRYEQLADPLSVSSLQIALLDEPRLSQFADAPDGLVIYAARSERLADHLAVYKLASWNQDDFIEYLLAVHRPRCASVMARVRAEDHLLLGGLPELWRIALDRLASDETIPDVRRALHRHLEEHLTDTDLLERARSACLNVLVTPDMSLVDAVTAIARPGFADSLIRVLRHPPMQLLLASERIAADLHGEADCDYLAKRLPRDLVEATGRLIA